MSGWSFQPTLPPIYIPNAVASPTEGNDEGQETALAYREVRLVLVGNRTDSQGLQYYKSHHYIIEVEYFVVAS